MCSRARICPSKLFLPHKTTSKKNLQRSQARETLVPRLINWGGKRKGNESFSGFLHKKPDKLFQSVLTITSWTGASNYTQFQNRVQEVSQKYSYFWDLLGLPLAWQSWGNYWVMVLCRFPPMFLVATNQWMWTILSPISTTDSLSMAEPWPGKRCFYKRKNCPIELRSSW